MSDAMHRREMLATTLAGFAATQAGFAANETLQIGCIGTGGRCRRLMETLKKISGVRITAVCDVWDDALAAGRKLADPKAFATKDYHELLGRKDVDAILIGSPDHWHVAMTVDACSAGKDVYVEKPLTHDLGEGQAVVDAEKKYKRIIQVGTQQRSMPHFQKGFEIVKSGQLGPIHRVHLSWNRNTPRHQTNKIDLDPKSVDWKRFLGSARQQPFDAYRMRNWRWFWDFGGGILTDLMVHFHDVANWYLDLGNPATAASIGDHYMTKGIWETPDTIQTLIHYPDKQVQVFFEGTFFNARNAARIEFMGRDATLYLDRGRYEIHPERGRKLPASELILGKGPRGADFYETPDGEHLHLTNWIDCVRSRKTPNCPAEEGVKAVLAAHLGNRAYRTGQVAKWGQ